MATKIRLKRLGKIRSPHYRIIVIDSRAKRDGKAIEEIGLYHPKNDPSLIQVNSERALYWLGVGAQPTEAVVALLKRSGDWQKHTGDTSASGIEEQKERPNKTDLFNKALADANDEPSSAAISKSKRSSKKADDAEAEAPAEEATEAAEVEADEAPAAEAPAEAEAAEADAPADEA
ncbi:30S ribosomal protein S16 [Aestuariimicrobium ganziense]|uniref:30S ribosomal protein S16 n=1 Tax=Aestuariimicrobium ganziense TaxID=2773677 RepID=UPI0019423DEF|nr:30S ribosomal protein S16 [Aestuariimicrobium ganziense]